MTEQQAIRQALRMLRTGQALDVVKAIEVLSEVLTHSQQCESCISPMYCELNDRCQKNLIKEA